MEIKSVSHLVILFEIPPANKTLQTFYILRQTPSHILKQIGFVVRLDKRF